VKKTQLSKIIKEETRKTLLEQSRLSKLKKALGIGRKPKQEPIKIPKPKRKIPTADEALNTPWEKIIVSDPKNPSRSMISDEYAESLRSAFGMKAGVDSSRNNAYLSMFNLNRGTPYVQGAVHNLVYKYATPRALIDDMNTIAKFSEFNPQMGLTNLSKLDSGLTNMVAQGHRNFQAIMDNAVKYGDEFSFSGAYAESMGIIVIRRLDSKRPDFAQRVKNRLDNDPDIFNSGGVNKGDIILAFPKSLPGHLGKKGSSPIAGMPLRSDGIEPETIRRILKNFMSLDFKAGSLKKTDDVGVMLIDDITPGELRGGHKWANRRQSSLGDQDLRSGALKRSKEKSGKYSRNPLDDTDPRVQRAMNPSGAVGPKDASGNFRTRKNVEFYERIIRQEVRKLLNEIKNS